MEQQYAKQGQRLRFKRGLGANAVMQAIQFIVRFGEAPLFIWALGASGYGEWLMLSAIPSVLTLSDGGFVKTTNRSMALFAGHDDWQSVLRVYQTGWAMLSILSASVVALMACTLSAISLADLMHLKTVAEHGANLAFFLLATRVLVRFQCGLIHGAFAAQGKYATGTLYTAGFYFFSFAGTAGGLILNKDIFSASVGGLAGALLATGAMALALRVSSPKFSFGFQHSTWKTMRELLAPSTANMAFPLGDALNMQGMRLVVGSIAGPQALALFSTLRTLCRSALQPVLAIARTIEPEISLSQGSANAKRRARHLYLHSTRLALWASIAIATIVLLIGKPVYLVWTTGKLPFDFTSFAVLLIASILNGTWNVSLAAHTALNRHIRLAIIYLCIFGLAVIGISAVSVTKYGTVGGAFAILASEAAMLAIATKSGCLLMEVSEKRLLSYVASPSTKRLRAKIRKVLMKWRSDSSSS